MAVTLVTLAVMVGLGYFVVDRFRSIHLRSYAEIAEIYVSQFLEPYALAYVNGGAKEHALENGREATLARQLAAAPAKALQVWLPDGTLLYSSAPKVDAAQHDDTDLRLAIAGNFVSHIETPDDADLGLPLPSPFLEIYIPIRDPESQAVIAVGELYVDATEILANISHFEQAVWWAIGLATLAVVAMLALSAKQSEELRELLAAEQRLASQNDILRREADQARLEASQSNEQTLNLVGAEIHDGPIQLLGLVSLMSKEKSDTSLADGSTMFGLVARVTSQLRELSAGLILPEIEHLDLREVVELAISRHRALTGAAVELSFEASDLALDTPRLVCLYRVIQEGLTNASRHGDGGPAMLSLVRKPDVLDLSIRSGPAVVPRAAADEAAGGLGLQGMRRRLDAFNGRVRLENIGEAAILQVTMPLA